MRYNNNNNHNIYNNALKPAQILCNRIYRKKKILFEKENIIIFKYIQEKNISTQHNLRVLCIIVKTFARHNFVRHERCLLYENHYIVNVTLIHILFRYRCFLVVEWKTVYEIRRKKKMESKQKI